MRARPRRSRCSAHLNEASSGDRHQERTRAHHDRGKPQADSCPAGSRGSAGCVEAHAEASGAEQEVGSDGEDEPTAGQADRRPLRHQVEVRGEE